MSGMAMASGMGAVQLLELRDAVELGEDLTIVAHEQERRLMFGAGLAQQGECLGGERGIEIAGGFVGEDELRTIGEGACHSDALLHPFDGAGRTYMQYVNDRGTYHDVPAKFLMREMARDYANMQGEDLSGRDMEREAAEG